MIIDLDGTLVQTEKLKALSYVKAAVELSPGDIREDQVVEAFKNVVGLSRGEVAQSLVDRCRCVALWFQVFKGKNSQQV
jgi:hypothetical protein